MKRYLNLLVEIARMNLMVALTYRANFYAGIITTLSWVVFAVTAVVIYSHQSTSVIGWSLNELISLTGVFSIVTGLAYSLFLRSFESLAERINTGDLDLTLTKPVDSQLLSTTNFMSLHNLFRFVAGIALLAFSTRSSSLNPTYFIAFAILLISSILILYSIWLLLVTLNFYTRRLDNVIGLLLELFDQTSRTPSDTFRVANSWAFNFLLPLFMVVSFPTKALWGKLPIEWTLATVITAIVLFFLSRKFWQFSLSRYSSASS